ncbi:hypothetical protein CTEN210_03032 [Chaetoceros tenuissimus]|uniref:Uncharacterized protein n=1 Tax=Chaetoceros tenuissimus TaxID=426638 RepID=A0AAD3CJ21_9STRA|nr:hypothetical protein CTEN210_03032 [Chaetoceros tenuissimus]
MGDVHVPTLIKGIAEIPLIKAGFAHSAIVTKVDAQLFTFGNNESGQLGLRNETNQSKPTKVHFHRDSKYSTYSVIDVDCGNLHTLALVVPVDFQEYQEHKSLIRRMKCGILVLEKFARLVLMKRRMRLFRETLKSRKEAQIQVVKPRLSSPLLEQNQSEHSDESSTESSNHSTNDEVIQVTSTLDELVAFESEDELSKLMTKRILRLEAYKQKKRLILLTEVQREREQIRMFQENILSRKKNHRDRIERLRKRIQTRKIDETRIEDKSKLSTVNQNIQKPLQTMKKKKKTKILPSRPTKLLTKEKNISLVRRKEPSKPKMPSKKRNDILLERRKARLVQQALKEQQEQERIVKEEQQRQLHEDAAKKTQESVELERKERLLRRKKMLSNFTKKKRLHNTINTRMTEATNPNKNKKTFDRSFKSVSDWNHQL